VTHATKGVEHYALDSTDGDANWTYSPEAWESRVAAESRGDEKDEVAVCMVKATKDEKVRASIVGRWRRPQCAVRPRPQIEVHVSKPDVVGDPGAGLTTDSRDGMLKGQRARGEDTRGSTS